MTQNRQTSELKRGDSSKDVGAGLPLLILLLAVFCFSMATFFILLGGMLPSLVAYLANDKRRPYRLHVITACNFAGVIPHLGMLWARRGNLDYAFGQLSDPFVWASMFMGALFGIIVYQIGPHIAAGILNSRLRTERRKIERIKQILVEEWGRDVLPAQDVSKSESDTASKTAQAKAGGKGQKKTAPPL